MKFCYLPFRCHCLKRLQIDCTSPVGLAARQTKCGASQLIQASANIVQRSAMGSRSGPDLIQSVYEDWRTRVECLRSKRDEIASGGKCRACLTCFCFERLGLSGAWLGQKDIGAGVAPTGEQLRCPAIPGGEFHRAARHDNGWDLLHVAESLEPVRYRIAQKLAHREFVASDR